MRMSSPFCRAGVSAFDRLANLQIKTPLVQQKALEAYDQYPVLVMGRNKRVANDEDLTERVVHLEEGFLLLTLLARVVDALSNLDVPARTASRRYEVDL